MIEIILNGQPHQLSENISISNLLSQLELQNKRLAVEVNNELIPKSHHATHYLKAGDKLEIVHAIGGG
jgi:sulfur carrier protein